MEHNAGKDRKAIYLKANRSEAYAFQNISRWVDVAYLLDYKCFVLCDDMELATRIRNEVILSSFSNFIESNKDEFAQVFVTNIANKNWENAAYAHLTTFTHAKMLGVEYFWNIDADDTMICLGMDRIVEMMKTVEKYAEKNEIDIFSLDMWRTKWNGKHWSFGITYANNAVDWIHIMKKHCEDREYKDLENAMNYNIDCFFTYLKNITELKIETFYFENLKFIHYSGDFFKGLISSAFYHWKCGELEYPIMRNCVGLNEMSYFPVYPDIVKLDIGILDNEAGDVLTYYSRDGHEFRGLVDWSHVINKELFEIKRKMHLKQIDGSELICFGVGNCLDNSIEKIKRVSSLSYVCDNDSEKWGKEYFGVKCISPDELKRISDAVVVISIYSKSVSDVITEQLKGMGIKNIFLIEDYLRCVE